MILFQVFFFFFNDTATTEIYTLSLHDALPISRVQREQRHSRQPALEPAADAERPLGEDADDAPALERGERLAQRADVGAVEVEGDRADVPVERRVQRRRTPDAR